MKTNVRQTSINAYYENVNTIKARLYSKILTAITEIDGNSEGITRGEIAFYTKLEKSTVSARVNELLKFGVLKEIGKRKDKITNITSYILIIDYDNRQLFL